ncbi:MAG TPA: UvrD-helicase domain-containing protein, partial [Gemmatimonadaceae bacterium]|nr:UvrD-helicase domain-containing protein [Gemmatimonadaceae bacterium]
VKPVPEDFLSGDGTYLVEASAGTGKTYWMVNTAVRLLLEGSVVSDPERLLAVTFTRAATAELKERLRKKLHELRDAPGAFDPARIAQALAAMDRLPVTTIHGFCKGVLEEFALECGVPVGLDFLDDISAYVDAAVADEWRSLTWEDSPSSEIVLGALMGGGDARWTPKALREAALVVRGAIGAVRPERLASRAAGSDALHEALRALPAVFDAARLRRFVADVTWNKDGPSVAAVDDLAATIADIEAGRAVMVGELRRWSYQAIRDSASKVKKANQALIDAEPLLPLVTKVVEVFDDSADALWQDAVLSIVERIERGLKADRAAGFDDMIAMVQRALDGEHGPQLRRVLRDRYDAVLVDEFQDTDWAQWHIFSSAFAGRPLILVGDPKQSIYAFRGADIFAYRKAKETAERSDRLWSLDKNWRSDRGVVDATGLLFAAEEPFAVPRDQLAFHPVTAQHQEPYITGDPEATPLVMVDSGTDTVSEQERRIARYVAAEIVRLLNDKSILYHPKDEAPRPIEARDIAILVRKHKQAKAIVAALRRLRVPVVTAVTGDITDSETWADLLALIAAINDPSDDRAVRRALVTALSGHDAASLHALVQDEAAWRRHVERLTQARRDWVRRGMLTGLTRLLADPLWQSVAQLSRRADAERRLTDLRHITMLMQKAERQGHRAPSGILSWARRFADRSSEEKEARALHLESDREAVQVTTIHAAKGLEWPIVFCPHLWSADPERKRFAWVVRRAGDERRHVRLNKEPFDDEAPGDSELSESLRLAYVALTRAKARSYVVHASGKRNNGVAPLAHLMAHYGEQPCWALARESEDVSVVHIAEGASARPEPMPPQPHADREYAAASRPIAPAQLQSWGMSSYTALTAAAYAQPVMDEPGPVDEPEAEEPSDDPTLRADQLPGGAHVGNALHAIFERLDFTRHDDAPYRDALIDEVMASYALPRPNADAAARAAAAELIRRMVAQTLSVPIPGAAQALASVPMHETLREWRFHLPVHETTAAKLADAFRAAGAPWLAEEYAPRLAQVSSRELRGFLTGVVDLVARIDGRWWIVDWKSNTLGATGRAYEARACRDEMIETHYVLQYHLYAVALHRFLKHRVRGYDYARDFGGAGYAFLRGLAMGVPSWFGDRPSAELIIALDAALGGGQA